MYNRILTLPLQGESSLFLFGPRGTGKTSWIKTHMPDALYLNLLDFATFNTLSINPGRLEGFIGPDNSKWIVIDEVQRVPELLNEVHKLINDRKLRFLLTGSSSRTLRRKGVNLLAGRALRYHMHPLVIQELKEAFDLPHVLRYGLLPQAITHQDPANYLESYVQTYLREEVAQEGLTRNVGIFARFLEIASYSQGQVLNASEIAREVGTHRITVTNFFDILEDLLIATRISVFTQRAKRKMVAHQKFYFFDTGVYRVLRPTSLLDTKEETEGVTLETLFFQSLRAVNDYYRLGYTIYFWRTLQGHEVDFILYGPQGFFAFEIKRSDQINNKILSGLKNFGQDYPEAKLYLINLGKFREYHGNINVVPFVDALKELPELLLNNHSQNQ